MAWRIRPVLKRKLATSVAVSIACRTFSVLLVIVLSKNHREKNRNLNEGLVYFLSKSFKSVHA